MDFFGIGLGELLLILVLALIIWGPKKLPDIAQKLGKTIRALRKATFDLTTEVTKEIGPGEKSHPHPHPQPQTKQHKNIKPKKRKSKQTETS